MHACRIGCFRSDLCAISARDTRLVWRGRADGHLSQETPHENRGSCKPRVCRIAGQHPYCSLQLTTVRDLAINDFTSVKLANPLAKLRVDSYTILEQCVL